MSLSEYVCYENKIRNPETGRSYLQKTTKEEWIDRLEFVYKRSKEYIALGKTKSDAYINYMNYNNKYLYTNDKDTKSITLSHLYSLYSEIRYKQFHLGCDIGRAFAERFQIPTIKNPGYVIELEHYLYCCELYASHRLKGMHYNLPFPLEAETVTTQVNEFKVAVEVSKPVENTIPEKPEGKWEDLKVIRKISKPLIIKEKKKYPKKHTLSILLTQEKEKTKKLQELLGQTASK